MTHCTSLCTDLKNLLAKNNFKDFTITLKDSNNSNAPAVEFKIHKFLLVARSSVLADLIEQKPDARNLNLVDIPRDAFEKILEYLYEGIFPEISTNGIFSLAKKLDLKELVKFLEEKSEENLTDEIENENSDENCKPKFYELKSDESGGNYLEEIKCVNENSFGVQNCGANLQEVENSCGIHQEDTKTNKNSVDSNIKTKLKEISLMVDGHNCGGENPLLYMIGPNVDKNQQTHHKEVDSIIKDKLKWISNLIEKKVEQNCGENLFFFDNSDEKYETQHSEVNNEVVTKLNPVYEDENTKKCEEETHHNANTLKPTLSETLQKMIEDFGDSKNIPENLETHQKEEFNSSQKFTSATENPPQSNLITKVSSNQQVNEESFDDFEEISEFGDQFEIIDNFYDDILKHTK